MPNFYKSIFFLFILISQTSCAERVQPEPTYTKITPELITINTDQFSPHKLTYKKLGNEMNYVVSKTRNSNHEFWKVEIYFGSDLSSKPDTIWLDNESFAFRRRLLSMPDYTIDVSMNDQLFSGELTPTENSTYTLSTYNKIYPHDAFEPAIINYAIAALPLKLGYSASIPVFDLNNGSDIFWSNIKVMAEETITIDKIPYDCWKVESDGIRNKTIWISKQHLFAVKMKTSGNAGAWEVVPSSITFN